MEVGTKKEVNEIANNHRLEGHDIKKVGKKQGHWIQYSFHCSCGWSAVYDN